MKSPPSKLGVADGAKPRVIHVLGALTIGGIETWLVHVFRNLEDSPIQHELLLFKDEVGPYEAEVRQLGIKIHRLRFERDPFRWFQRAVQFFREQGPIAAVHSHGSIHFIPIVLAAAWAAGVPIRIGHSHAARHVKGAPQTLKQRFRRALSIPAIRLIASRRIGISEPAIEYIGGRGWSRNPRSSVLLYGFDYSRNEGAAERAAGLRRELGIGEKTVVIGHVGRFDPVKNHELLVRSFARFVKSEPDSALVLVGEGETRAGIAELGHSLGISDKLHLPGATDDVPAYMAMFDLFVLPSLSEGLGIVCLEAQAAGTRSLVSDRVPREVVVVPEAISVLDVESGEERWAGEIRRLAALTKPDAAKWRIVVESSVFGMRRCVAELNEIYASELERAGAIKP